jgi:co-chaperonin GroES (HSP10)
MNLPLTPYGARVLVTTPDQTDLVRGVYLSSEIPKTDGIVVAIGTNVDPWFHLGQRLTFHHFAGTKLSIGGVKYKLLPTSEVLGEIDLEVDDVAIGAS